MYNPGDSIGPYKVVRRFKAGGMATLYLAQRAGASGFSRFVAIKVVHQHLAEDEKFVQMFIDEANLSSRVEHPNVVHIEELGQHHGAHYLVMEFVHGVSVAQILKSLSGLQQEIPVDVAVRIGIAVAAALHAAHETKGDDGSLLGVVHRDVTHDNVLVSFKGHVKVIDFGVAKAGERSNETRAGTLKGKFAYMAPEQAKAGVVDRRTDIYALGIALWEMLTMRRLFKANSDLEILDMVRNPPPVQPPSEINPKIPKALDEVIIAALSANPSDRPKSARAFRKMLAAALPTSMLVDQQQIQEWLQTIKTEEFEEERTILPSDAGYLVSVDDDDEDEDAVTSYLKREDLEAELAKPRIGNEDETQINVDLKETLLAFPQPVIPTATAPKPIPQMAPQFSLPTPATEASRPPRRVKPIIAGLAFLVLLGLGFIVGSKFFEQDTTTVDLQPSLPETFAKPSSDEAPTSDSADEKVPEGTQAAGENPIDPTNEETDVKEEKSPPEAEPVVEATVEIEPQAKPTKRRGGTRGPRTRKPVRMAPAVMKPTRMSMTSSGILVTEPDF